MNNEIEEGAKGLRQAPLIVLAGNIAVGKSTIADLLGAQMAARTYSESVVDNPYLERYYADMPTWTFHLNMYFLANRARQLMEAATSGGPAILDRSFYEDRIFVEQAHDEGHTGDDAYAIFRDLDGVLNTLLPRPGVLIYLHAPVSALVQRIRERARTYESGISESFLADLQTRYSAWIASYDYSPVIQVDTVATDLRRDPGALGILAAEITSALSAR